MGQKRNTPQAGAAVRAASNVSERSSSAALVTAAAVLGRLANISGTTNNDSALARALGVSHTTLANWRHRGTVPYEAAVKYAAEHNLSLDFVLLGRGPSWASDSDTGHKLLFAIIEALKSRLGTGQEGLISSWADLIYQRVVSMTGPHENPFNRIQNEIDYLEMARAGLVRGKPEAPHGGKVLVQGAKITTGDDTNEGKRRR